MLRAAHLVGYGTLMVQWMWSLEGKPLPCRGAQWISTLTATDVNSQHPDALSNRAGCDHPGVVFANLLLAHNPAVATKSFSHLDSSRCFKETYHRHHADLRRHPRVQGSLDDSDDLDDDDDVEYIDEYIVDDEDGVGYMDDFDENGVEYIDEYVVDGEDFGDDEDGDFDENDWEDLSDMDFSNLLRLDFSDTITYVTEDSENYIDTSERFGNFDTDRAHMEEDIFRDAPMLAPSSSNDAAEVLQQDGVVRLDRMLSPEAAAPLRESILSDLEEVLSCAEPDPDRFSNILSPYSLSETEMKRWDFRLRITTRVREAVMTLLAGAVGDVFESIIGPDAELYELAAFVSAPGSEPQPLHGDSLWNEEGGLYTAVVSLQSVSEDMGPIRFVRGSNTEEAHAEFDDRYLEEGGEETFAGAWKDRAVRGLLDVGDVAIYDARTIHAGGQNVHMLSNSATEASDEGIRVLFYVTFRGVETDDEDLNIYSLLPEYRERFTLDQLRHGSAEEFQDVQLTTSFKMSMAEELR